MENERIERGVWRVLVRTAWRDTTLKRIIPFDLVYGHYKLLKGKLDSTADYTEKRILLKRLFNLLAVMEFLISINNTP